MHAFSTASVPSHADALQRPWLAHYPAGVPADIDTSEYASLAQLLEDAFTRFSERSAFRFMGREYSYAEIDHYSAQLAGYLQSLGLQKGDRVAVMLPNIIQYPVAAAAVMRAGLVLVNVNPLYTVRELEHQLQDCGAKVMVVLEQFAASLQQCLDKTHAGACGAGVGGRYAGAHQGPAGELGAAQASKSGACV